MEMQQIAKLAYRDKDGAIGERDAKGKVRWLEPGSDANRVLVSKQNQIIEELTKLQQVCYHLSRMATGMSDVAKAVEAKQDGSDKQDQA